MSMSLVWTRKVECRDSFETGLKWKLEKKFRIPCDISTYEVGYIEGLRDGFEVDSKEHKQLSALLDAIAKYDEVRLEYR